MAATDPDAALVADLAVRARQLAGRTDGEVRVLSRRAGGVVVRLAGIVVKAHSRDTDPDQLAARLRLATTPDLDGVLLRPLRHPDGRLVDRFAGRPVTAWPAGTPVDPDRPDDAPWSYAGTLLARLHQVAATGDADPVDHLPAPLDPESATEANSGAPARVARAMARLDREAGRHPAAPAVRGAYATLPRWAYGGSPAPADRPRTLCHGDWHLGQMVRVPDGWRLVDVDDLGYADPAWDLARPAAWYATGLMSPASWREFLDHYRAGDGPAVPSHGDPWPALDVVARALVAQMTANVLVEAAPGRALDEIEQTLVDTCRMIIAEYGAVDVP